MAAAGQHRFAIVALLCCIPFASQLALGCANPTTAYHRQFEYLRDVGDEALAEGRLEEAHEHLSDAAQLARIAGASELEFIEALTRLTQASRRLGRLSEASRQARTASRVLARHRLVDGSGGRALARVGGSYLLERARLEIALGDLAAAEVALVDFFRLRGEAGGNARDATEARWLRGELWLARGLSSQTQTQIQAQAEFRSARDSARSLDQVRDRPLVGYVAFRVAEAELADGRTSRATALVDEMRPGGMIVAPALRPGMLLLQARIDVAQGNRDRASVRLAESLILLAPGDDDADAGTADVSAPARAIFVASLVFDAAQSGEKLREAVARALDIAEGSSSLRSIHAGREAVTVGRELFDAGARQVGLQTMGRGRQIIALGLRGNDHEALVAVDFELAAALADADRLKAASARCDALVEASERLADPVRLELPERLLACGQIHARRGDATSARRIFARALLLGGDAPLEPQLRMELLLRMGALAHQQKRESEEDKLFERVLALILPGSHERVSELLVDTYRSLGWFAPSSAAARLAHVAARHPVYTAEARPLQAIAEELGDRAPPASP